MKPIVLDASALGAVLFQEPGAQRVRSLLVSRRTVSAPGLIYIEIGNVTWKRTRRGELEPGEAVELMQDVLRLPLSITPTGDLCPDALRLALMTGRTVYDAIYLALAVRLRGRVLTSDQRLANALAGGPLERYVAWIGGATT